MHKNNMINRGKINMKLNEVKPIENTKKNSENFLKVSPIQKKSPLHINCCKLKEDSLTEKLWNCNPRLSHTKQEYQNSLIQG